MANDDARLVPDATGSSAQTAQPDDAFQAELDAAIASLDAEPPSPTQAPSAAPGASFLTDKTADAITQNQKEVGEFFGSMVTGAAKGIIETKDFVSGLFGNDEPRWEDKWSVRQWIERKDKDLKKEGVVNGIASSLSQFGVGFVGLGKVKWVAQGLGKAKEAGTVAGLAAETARGALAGAIVMDPHDERLSNFVEAYPALSNPVTEYLAAKPTDSAAEGRLKNAMEGIVMDAVLVGAFAAMTRGIKLARSGDTNGANVAAAEADTLFAKAASQDSPEASALRPESSDASIALPNAGDANAGRIGNTGGAPPTGSPGLDGSVSGSALQAEGGGARSALQGSTSSPPTSSVGPDIPTVRDDATGGRALPEGPDGVRPADGDAGGRRQAARADVEFTDEELGLALARARIDQEAILTHGSRERAIAAGYVFKGGDASGVIPYQKLNTADETQAWMGQLIGRQSAFINKMRGGDAKGVLKDAEVERIVAERARTWGDNPAKLKGIIKQAGDEAPNIVANLETSFLLANRAYQDSYELAVRIQSNNFTGFSGRAEALAALKHRMATATAMYATGKSIITNSARAMRRMRGEFRISDEQLASLRTSDPEEMLRLVNSTNGDPQALVKLSKQTIAHRVIDGLSGYQAANLLWGWKTQVVNIASSAAMLVWRPMETVTGSLGTQAKAALKGDGEAFASAALRRSQAVREVTYLSSTLMDGWHAGAEAFMRGNSRIIPFNAEAFTVTRIGAGDIREVGQAWREIKTADDLVRNLVTSTSMLIGGSLRAMGAADEVFKTMRYRAIISAKASMEADAAGLQAGSQAYKDLITKRLDDAFDDAGRGIDETALNEAKVSTFQQDLVGGDDTWVGGWSKGYSTFAAQNNAFKLITPFIKTPANLIRYGVKLTPGANLLQKEFLDAIRGAKGEEEHIRAVGQMMMGVTLTSIAGLMWGSGRIVAGGPRDPEQRKAWVQQGNQPYSLVWHDDAGVKQSLPLNRFDPIFMPLSLTADFLSTYTSGQRSEEDNASMATSIVMAVTNVLRDKTYLRGINEFLKAITDDRSLDAWVRRFAPGFVPMSSLMPMVSQDPVLHEVRTTLDAVINRIPGLSDNLPPQRDIFGDVVMAPTGFVSAQRNSGPVMQALDAMFAETGRFIDPPSPRRDGVDLRDITLKASGRSAYDRYQELIGRPNPDGPTLKETLAEVVASDDFKILPHGNPVLKGTKGSLIMNVISDYRRAAFDMLKGENPDLVEALEKEQRKVIDKVERRTNAVSEGTPIEELDRILSAYGITSNAVHPGSTRH